MTFSTKLICFVLALFWLAVTIPLIGMGDSYTPTKSGIIKAFMYNEKTQALTLLFDSGVVREHKKVPKELYKGLLDAPLKGGYYRSFIEGTYEFEERSSRQAKSSTPAVETP